MDEEHRESGPGGVWSVPIGEGLCGGPMGGEKSMGAEKEECRNSKNGCAVEVEGVVAHVARPYSVHNGYTL